MIRIMVFDLIDARRLLGDRMKVILARFNFVLIECPVDCRKDLTDAGIWWE